MNEIQKLRDAIESARQELRDHALDLAAKWTPRAAIAYKAHAKQFAKEERRCELLLTRWVY
jgi:hypothetical protein